MVKLDDKTKAVDLRKKGLSYSAILREVPVAKSTLSLWLRDVGLSKRQVVTLTEKRLSAARRGALARKLDRIKRTEQINKIAISELGDIDKKTFLLVGAALYWAEGNKQKIHSVSIGVKFSNSDPEMIKFFNKWLKDFCGVKQDDLKYELYIHETGDINRAKKYWENILSIGNGELSAVRIKKGNSVSYRKNKGENYFGLIRINVKRSTDMNRRIMAWAEGLCKQFK